ncbi:MAG: thiamine pyrophosphate-dependent dehydrogenase E1 component subunit alpha [Polaromonas sp.]|uniref:thiamine pyrophosphate-dependent dehydrogenase E1 component subunit alpha n=1 Tax=Polaromonas sp. TaxID=1869339 RepID=UPI0027293D68|nr:thiamine pyrophosphate-dependent dehydrogenase E1 component subunit alpha [Polaromonas sp.]MDO9113491.1 thiamine pyrophosphate-dependent dehydrogenase E1 component subunit alpha [Polaromonas sp.]MDP1886435.1 thiamine pyrophosphate-dependent dehydrogenase E1 component subunit alpha [Polaromonas sp.]
MEASTERLLWMYETMLVIRRYEETMAQVYLEGKLPPQIQKGLAFDIASGPVPGEMHLAAGQEPVAVGVCAHLTDADTVVGTHRPHHFAIAKGVPLDRMTAEIFGKVTGLGRGKGGHMHLFDPARRFSCSGIVGASMPPACGAGLAAKKLGTKAVAVAFFGEGAANQGAFHESLNLAALWKLPVVFVCEDNRYAISVPKAQATSVVSNATRAAAYGMEGIAVGRNDAIAVHDAAAVAVRRAREGGGPTLIEVKTDRYMGHFQGDAEVYRPKGEVDELRKSDPIPALGNELRRRGLLDDAKAAAIATRAEGRVVAAFTFARESAYPPAAEATEHLFA